LSGKGTPYLFGRIHDATVPEPAIHLKELGLILKGKLMGDRISRQGFPLKKLIALSEEFSSDIRVELDLMRISIIGNGFHGEVRERDRLVH
jgi:hypothetical protein